MSIPLFWCATLLALVDFWVAVIKLSLLGSL
jgi:hypothetical protein